MRNRNHTTRVAQPTPEPSIDLGSATRMVDREVGDALLIKYLSTRHGRVIDRVGTVVDRSPIVDAPTVGDDGDPSLTLRCKERRDRTRALVVNVRTGRVTSNGFYLGPLVDVEHIEDPVRVRRRVAEQVSK